ncbi:MAG: alpha/beta fold hydrolase [Pseudomonadota bacterium]
MSVHQRPDEVLTAFWSQTADLWQAQAQAWQHWLAAGQAALAQQAAAPGPWQALAQAQQQVWAQWSAGLAASLPGAAPTSGQPDKLAEAAQANLRAALEVLTRATTTMAARLEQADPQALAAVWEGLAAEYRRDLADLPTKLKPARAEDLAGLARELSSANPSPQARRYLDRFVETMRVKAVQGAEYYVDASRVEVGPTPREKVLELGSLELYRYRATADAAQSAGRPPVLLIYSIINRPWILDLVPGFSLIAHLLARGLDVYMVEWKPATAGCTDTLDAFIDPWLDAAVDKVRALSGAARVGMLGYCIGGTIAAMYAARFPDKLASLLTLTTPLVGTGSGVLGLLVNPAVFPIDEIVAANQGVVPGKTVRHSIIAIKPYLEVLKWKAYYENLHDERMMYLFEPIDRWANDNPDLPGEVFRSFVHEVYHEDRLARGQTLLHGEPLDLGAITCPLLNLVADEDWIVPREAAVKVTELVGSAEKATEIIPGPHVGIIMDPRTRPVWDRIADFIAGHAAPAAAEEA